MHNLKIAVRNLCKYRLQTAISVLSIAVGIVTLSTVHSIMRLAMMPAICGEPYYDRICRIYVDSINGDDDHPIRVEKDVLTALKRNGGLRTIEGRPLVPNNIYAGGRLDFRKGDTLRRRVQTENIPIDGAYPNHLGYRSAITGRKVAVMKKGEAIMSASTAKLVFGDNSPIGATFTAPVGNEGMTFTVTDVFEDVSKTEGMNGMSVFYCIGDIEDYGFLYNYRTSWIEVVRRPECTLQQVRNEVDARLKPLGLKSEVSLLMETQKDNLAVMAYSNIISRVIGSLILLVAVIGYIRMQTQLFWMRRREIALRIINGVRSGQIFATLITEVVLTLTAAALLAVMAGVWVENFINNRLAVVLDNIGFTVDNLWLYSIVITVALTLICAVIVWVTLHRIRHSAGGLAASMRRSSTHWFRNIMLGVQIVISMLFVCCTLELVQGVEGMKESYYIPEDESVYKNSIVVNIRSADNREKLQEALRQLPDVERVVAKTGLTGGAAELSDNENLTAKRGGISYYQMMITADTAFIDFYKINVKWFKRAVDRSDCVLVEKGLYDLMTQSGMANTSTIRPSWNNMLPMPIAGTFEGKPYDKKNSNDQMSIIIIKADMADRMATLTLVPRKGKYPELLQDVNATIGRLEPEVVSQMAFNYYDKENNGVLMLDTMNTSACILSLVSLIVCVMSIYTTITLDTRARRKEV